MSMSLAWYSPDALRMCIRQLCSFGDETNPCPEVLLFVLLPSGAVSVFAVGLDGRQELQA